MPNLSFGAAKAAPATHPDVARSPDLALGIVVAPKLHQPIGSQSEQLTN